MASGSRSGPKSAEVHASLGQLSQIPSRLGLDTCTDAFRATTEPRRIDINQKYAIVWAERKKGNEIQLVDIPDVYLPSAEETESAYTLKRLPTTCPRILYALQRAGYLSGLNRPEEQQEFTFNGAVLVTDANSTNEITANPNLEGTEIHGHWSGERPVGESVKLFEHPELNFGGNIQSIGASALGAEVNAEGVPDTYGLEEAAA